MNTTLLPFYLFILGVPLAVAGQNFVAGFCLIILLWQLIKTRKADRPNFFAYPVQHFLILIFFVLWMIFSTLINPAHPKQFIDGFIGQFLPLLILPALFYWQLLKIDSSGQRKIFNLLSVIVAIIGLISLSQAVFGWRLQGSGVERGFYRAQAFYSHPLTLAYIIILFFPAGLISVLKKPKSWQSWALFLGTVAAIWASRSRIIQVICLCLTLINIFMLIKGRLRFLLVAVVAGVVLLVAFTKNPVSENFRYTLEGKADRWAKDYPDDRVAFWHAHWLMFKDRPIVGQGIKIPRSMRIMWYEKIGLGDFKKIFTAHNIYLQTAAEGGVVGLAIYLTWCGWLLVILYRRRHASILSLICLQTWLVFHLASFTQNAFQDAEVKYGLILLTGFSFFAARNLKNTKKTLS